MLGDAGAYSDEELDRLDGRVDLTEAEGSEGVVIDLRSPARVRSLEQSTSLVETRQGDLPVVERTHAGRTLAEHEIPSYVKEHIDLLPTGSFAQPGPGYRFAKRVFDLAIAVPVLLLTLPIIAVLAIKIRLDSPGPAVFRQRRVGRNGEVFTFYKFRTMYTNARELFPEMYDYDFDSSEVNERYYKRPGDPRNTRLGAWIRKTSLDELPNLFNVLKGDTSIVGPRPELQEMVQHYRPEQLVKFAVKPGLTCLAASTGRNTLTIDEQIRADVEYATQQSFALDMRIVGQTCRTVVAMIGAE